MDAFPVIPKGDLDEIDMIITEGRRRDLEMQERAEE